MKKRVLLFVLVLICAVFVNVSADYLFSVPKASVTLEMNADGTMDVTYYYEFNNQGQRLDYIDIGTPNNNFSLSDVSVKFNGQNDHTIRVTRADPKILRHGITLEMRARSIPKGDSGTLEVRICGLKIALNKATSETVQILTRVTAAPQDEAEAEETPAPEEYTGESGAPLTDEEMIPETEITAASSPEPEIFETAETQQLEFVGFWFSPNWFGHKYVRGATDYTFTLIMPAGLANGQAYYYTPKSWIRNDKPEITTRSINDEPRIAFVWHSQLGNVYTQYTFGAKFVKDPAALAENAAIITLTPTITVTPTIRPTSTKVPVFSFEVPRADTSVEINPDGSLNIEIEYEIKNLEDPLGSLEIHVPKKVSDPGQVAVTYNGEPNTDIVVKNSGKQTSTGIQYSIILELGDYAIPTGEAAVIHVSIPNVSRYLDSPYTRGKKEYTGFAFRPNYFLKYIASKPTDYTFSLIFPVGVTEKQVVYKAPASWNNSAGFTSMTNDEGQLVWQWNLDEENMYTAYDFEAEFPTDVLNSRENFIPTPRPTSTPKRYSYSGSSGTKNSNKVLLNILKWVTIAGAAIFGLIKLANSNIGGPAPTSVVSSDDPDSSNYRLRSGYMPPNVRTDGDSIKRGLTAVEAAILLERNIEQVLTMILYGLCKKELITVKSQDPLEVEVDEKLTSSSSRNTLTKDLQMKEVHQYELDFAKALQTTDLTARQKLLNDMLKKLIKSVYDKVDGYSMQATKDYYRDVCRKAWKMVEDAGTQEMKNQLIGEQFNWLMMDSVPNKKIETLFTEEYIPPVWWSRVDPDYEQDDREWNTEEERTDWFTRRKETESEPKTEADEAVPVPGTGTVSASASSAAASMAAAASEPEPEPRPVKEFGDKKSIDKRETEKSTDMPVLPGASFARGVTEPLRGFAGIFRKTSNTMTNSISGNSEFYDMVLTATRKNVQLEKQVEAQKKEEEQRRLERSRNEERRRAEDERRKAERRAAWSSRDDDDDDDDRSSGSSSSSSSSSSSCACACDSCACACAGGGR